MRTLRSYPFHALQVVVGCLALMSGVSARATTVIKMSDEDLVRHSSIVVAGTVTNVRSEWNADQTQIHTIVKIAPGSFLKGALRAGQDSITLRVLGGTVGNITMWVVDSPVYTLDEEVLLMLRADYEQTLFPIVGFNQGKFRIEQDPVSGAKMIGQRNVSRDDFASKLQEIVEVQSPQPVGQQDDQAQEAGDEDE